ncbi:hypothetical protein SDC9_181985 [bioreactor metagenome]|uniref:Uncharacterized protein n=1 Tax=bioreactor metagenome TaxID=1076179 RepID=A0A645H636_9ZZZZ
MGHAALPQNQGIDVAHKQSRHVVEHDGNDHFIESAEDLKQARNGAPNAACQQAHKQGRDCRALALEAPTGSDPNGRHGTHDELPLAAQVKHTAAVSKTSAQAGEDERRGFHQRVADIGGAAECTLKEVNQGVLGAGTQGGDDDCAHQEGQYHRKKRHAHA